MGEMFCFQCEQTAGGTGCEAKAGVCGKSALVATKQDALTGALIALAQAQLASDKPASNDTRALIVECLFATVTNVDFSDAAITALIARVHATRDAVCLNGEFFDDYDVSRIWQADEDIRSLKSLILFGMRGMAAYAFHARQLNFVDDKVDHFFLEGLAALATDGSQDTLLPVVLGVGEANFTCMELLDRANTTTYGDPVPTEVPFEIEPGPFIVVTGHDLHDLKLLLEQTDGTGVNIYTHGEMLPAHGYPELKKHPQLKGNFGTAWQNQRKEFDGVPAPFLFTTNCLMPPKPSYADNIYTLDCVEFDGTHHIGPEKDFSELIARAKELGGYSEPQKRTGINGGDHTTTGFGRASVLANADAVVNAVKSGELKNIFLVGGCDGARPGRNYYTEFVEKTPADSLVLTLACGKFRFNDLDLGTVAGLPRLLDMGQCNDAFGAISVALALADVFGCGVNDLPLHMVLSWYEQKAVCILLTLLHLGVKNIYLGPTLPAFISPNVLNLLVEQYNIAPTSTPDEDLAKILA